MCVCLLSDTPPPDLAAAVTLTYRAVPHWVNTTLGFKLVSRFGPAKSFYLLRHLLARNHMSNVGFVRLIDTVVFFVILEAGKLTLQCFYLYMHVLNIKQGKPT